MNDSKVTYRKKKMSNPKHGPAVSDFENETIQYNIK